MKRISTLPSTYVKVVRHEVEDITLAFIVTYLDHDNVWALDVSRVQSIHHEPHSVSANVPLGTYKTKKDAVEILDRVTNGAIDESDEYSNWLPEFGKTMYENLHGALIGEAVEN